MRAWIARTGSAMADQALLSLSNFIASVLLARWTSPAEYSAFAIGMSLFLFVAGFHNALVSEPMSVLLPGKPAGDASAYLASCLRLHWKATGLMAALFLAAAAAFATAGHPLSWTLTSVGVSCPVILLFWLLRRFTYCGPRPGFAAIGALIYAIATGTGLAALRAYDLLTPPAVFALFGASSLAGSAALVIGVPRSLPRAVSVWPSHWNYGKWVVAVAAPYWLAFLAFPVLLGWFHSPGDAALFRASENLVQPIIQATAAISILLLPRVSRSAAEQGPAFLDSYSRRALPVVLTAACVAAGLAVLGGAGLRTLFYGPDAYPALAGIVPWLALWAAIRAVSDLTVALPLRAARRPDAIFRATTAAAFVVALGTPLLPSWGATAAAVTAVAASLVHLAALEYFRRPARLAGERHELA